MGGDQNVVPSDQVLLDAIAKEGHRPLDGIRQAFSAGRSGMVGPSPKLYLLLAKLGRRLRLIQTLQVTVVAFIQNCTRVNR